MARYDLDRFVLSPDPELICNICQSVYCEPTQTPCRHVFCKSCINTWLLNQRSCPTCRKRTTKISLRPVVPIIQNIINKLLVKCQHYDKGCEATISIESYESHIKECFYEMVTCENDLCFVQMLRKDLKIHKKKCKYRLVSCQHGCKLNIPKVNLKNHSCMEELKKKVTDLQREIKNVKEERTELKKQINQLEKKLKDQQNNRRHRSASVASVRTDDSWDNNWNVDFSSASEYTLDNSQGDSPQNSADNIWNWNVAFSSNNTSPRNRRANYLLNPFPQSSSFDSLLPFANTPESVGSTNIEVNNSQANRTVTNNDVTSSEVLTLFLDETNNRSEENRTSEIVPDSLPSLLPTTFVQSLLPSTTAQPTNSELQTSLNVINLDIDATVNNIQECETLNESYNITELSTNTYINENNNLQITKNNNSVPSDSELLSSYDEDVVHGAEKKPFNISKNKNNKNNNENKVNLPHRAQNGSKDMEKNFQIIPKMHKATNLIKTCDEEKPKIKKVNGSCAANEVKKVKWTEKEIDHSQPGPSGMANKKKIKKGKNMVNGLKEMNKIKFFKSKSNDSNLDQNLAKKSKYETLNISDNCIPQINKQKNKKGLANKFLNIKTQLPKCSPYERINFSDSKNKINNITSQSSLHSVGTVMPNVEESLKLNLTGINNIDLTSRTFSHNDLSNSYNHQPSVAEESSSSQWYSDNSWSRETMTESDYEVRIPKSTYHLLEEYVSDESDESWHPPTGY